MSYEDFPGFLGIEDENTARVFNYSIFTADDEPVTVTLNQNYISGKIPHTNTDFNTPLLWKKISISYRPPISNQYKHLTFRPSENEFQSYTSWSQYSQLGTWNLQKVTITGWHGGVLHLNDDQFSSSDDITITS